MGSRRLGRRRLFSLDKAGQEVDLGAGEGIKDAIVSTTQKREGHQIITEIALDLGTSKAEIKTSGTGGNGARKPFGVADKEASIGQLTVAKVGVVNEVRVQVLEAIVGGTTTFDLESANDGVGKSGAVGALGTGNTAQLDAITNTVGVDISKLFDANELADKFLYVCQGEDDNAAALTAGKLLITIYGAAVPADL
tara:strand:+ start:142 stop:726 length:585 start_codon:yes stop_codon:yes gene_type:complete